MFWICIYTCLLTEGASQTHLRRTSRTTQRPTTTVKPVTTHTTQNTSPTSTNAISLNTTTSPKPNQSTTSLSAIYGQSTVSKQQANKDGATTTAAAAGVSVTVAIAVSAVVFVLVLRNSRKLCFEHTKSPKLENRDANHHISLARVKSKPTAYYQTPGPSVSNQTYIALQNARTCTNNADKYNPVANIDVRHQNKNITQTNHDSEARAYFVFENDGFEQQISATNAIPTEEHDFFVLGKKQPNIGNRNGVSKKKCIPTLCWRKKVIGRFMTCLHKMEMLTLYQSNKPMDTHHQ
ncbi:hypothetical protein DPMN_077648 [Dreissena polymorpha]|uniref:Uncharacterized protein n=2 Tax=Dreissena polymorpha TaxID=45954 RepID=A0A9D3YP83_DREPO|nr:hypothetical protein DPMN_077648 [Dreissena polymorpha]